MKKIINILLFAFLSIIIASCEKETKLYDGEEGIYFAVQYPTKTDGLLDWAHQHLTPVEFINIAGHTDTVKIKVMTTGAIKDYDREFSVVVVPDTTTADEGLNYEPLESEYVVKAGEYFTHIPVVVMRTENIQHEEKNIVLKLIPNEHFTLSIPEWSKLPKAAESAVVKGNFKAYFHKIVLSDFVTQPSRWIGRIDGGFDAGSWGGFTEKKYRLISDHFNLVYEDFMSEETMPASFQENIREYMVRFLKGLNEQGTPILEEDGRLMWFSGVNWSSKVGVPYDPNK